MNHPIRVLFICEHDSGRSQIAAAYLKQMAGDRFVVDSAGFEPADEINPLVVAAMTEDGIDISNQKPQSVFEKFKAGERFHYVISVCRADADKCPLFPSLIERWKAPFTDPAKVTGGDDQKMTKVRSIRDQIKNWLLNPPEGSFSYKDVMN